ncbi:hypothetical protein IFM89_017757 [Coptis chinensis]|uniref:Ribosomal protein S14 n=1 Tax=Coptis chinensis TaxID=261450 RepID=A0A835I425_9MAGN|nr:hypothetical protein IFM89_017757 [Coptis chinensis]
MSRRKSREPKEENVTSLGPAVLDGEYVFGVAHIFASLNDTFIYVTDMSGRGSWFGLLVVAARCKELGITTLHIKLRAIGEQYKDPWYKGTSAQSALCALARFGLKIGHIEDVTPIPTDGTRRKSRKSLVLTIVVVIMVVDLCLVGTFFFYVSMSFVLGL